jgi:adenylate kinase
MADYYLLFGPPGVGKGTQADRLEKTLDLAHVATGDLFREHLKKNTPLGRLARSYIDHGALVPDDVTIGMVAERMTDPDTQKGMLLDGFPRTVAQADALSKMLADRGQKIQRVLFITASKEVLIERLGHRMTCSNCGTIYNAQTQLPKNARVCDVCGGEVIQRSDDTPDTQRKRIEVYLEQTIPLVDYFEQRGLLVTIQGEQSIDRVYDDLLHAIEAAKKTG